MSKGIWNRILATLIGALVLVSMASAHEISITRQARVGSGPELQPGAYKVEIVKNQDSAEVRFFREGDLVVQAPVTLSQETSKADHTAIHYEQINGEQVITQIHLQGSKEGLVFKPPTP